MRTGFLTTEYVINGRVSGGIANYLRRLCMALAKMGHEPHVFLYSSKTKLPELVDGVQIHYVGGRLGRFHHLTNRATRSRWRKTLRSLFFSSEVALYIRSVNHKSPFDIIQAANFSAPGLFVPILTDIPMVVRASSYRPLWNTYAEINRNLDSRIVEMLERIQFRIAKDVFAPSKWLATILEREVGLEKVTIIRTPFYEEVVKSDPSWYESHLVGRDYLLYFGAMQAHKGVHVLAEALPRVFERLSDLSAVFVGVDTPRASGMSMSEYVRQVCGEYGDRVIISTPLDHAQLYPVIKHARLVVLPSLVDNLPNTMLESMGLGKPVVGTFGTSLDELIQDGHSGFLVPPGDAHALADKICEVWERSDLEQIGNHAKSMLADLSPDVVVNDLLGYYKHIIGDKC